MKKFLSGAISFTRRAQPGFRHSLKVGSKDLELCGKGSQRTLALLRGLFLQGEERTDSAHLSGCSKVPGACLWSWVRGSSCPGLCLHKTASWSLRNRPKFTGEPQTRLSEMPKGSWASLGVKDAMVPRESPAGE